MQRSIFLALLVSVAAIGACSLINAPESVRAGGAGGSGGGGSSSSGASKCTDGADCKNLDDVCGIGACVNGACQKLSDPAKEGQSCDDGLFCTDKDTCQAGTCKGSPRDCPAAADACHVSSCNEVGKTCLLNAAADGTKCDDGNPCTSDDTCVLGKCTAGSDCSKLATDCVSSTCMPGVGCQTTNINEKGACDKSNPCAQSQCMAGACTPVSFAPGAACDDGLYCTDADTCDNKGKCAGAPKKCPGADPCNVSACDEAAKTCGLMVLADGMACDDANACTLGTTCKGGKCTAASTISACVNGDGCCPAACAVGQDSDCIRPNLLLCGSSARDVLTFVPAGVNLSLVQSCAPDTSTQAMLVSRSFNNAISAATLTSYLDNGGIVLTEFNISDEVYSLAFGATQQGTPMTGSCTDVAPTVTQFTLGDPIWAAVPFQAIAAGQTGCGYPVGGYAGIVPLAGWSANQVAIGYRDHNAGRVWVTDFDWQDGDTPANSAAYAFTNTLMGYMITHRK